MRERVVFGVLVGLALVGSGDWRVYAAHFDKRSEQTDRNVPPTPGPGEASICGSTAAALSEVTVLPNLIKVQFESSFSVTGDDPSCVFNGLTAIGEIISAEVVADGGDSVGAPVPICLRFDRFQDAFSTSGYTAESDIGASGNAAGAPLIVARSTPAVVIEFSDGPTVVTSGNVSQSFTRQFTANVGDFIDINLGGQSSVKGTGIGSSNATANGLLTVRIGSCAGSGAPVASHAGLAGLALALSAAGMLLLRRRSVRRSAD